MRTLSKARVPMAALVVLGTGLALWAAPSQDTAEPTVSVDAIIARVAEGEGAIRNVRGYFTYVSYLPPMIWREGASRVGNTPVVGSDKQGVLPVVRKVLLACSEGRFRGDEREVLPPPASGVDYYARCAFDGRRLYYWASDSVPSIHLKGKRGYVMAPDVVAYELNVPWFERSMLSERLRRARISVVGQEDVGGITCYRLDRLDVKDVRHSWWIAPSRGHRLAKEVILVPGQRGSHVEVLAWKQYGVTWLPDRVQRRRWKYMGEKEIWHSTEQIQTEELEVNTAEPLDHLFGLEFPLGEKAMNAEEEYVVGGDTSSLQESLFDGRFPPDVDAEIPNVSAPDAAAGR